MCHNPLDRVTCRIKSNIEIAVGIFDMTIHVGSMSKLAKPGQFVNLYCYDSAKLLPRPISICDVDVEAKTLRLVYAAVGEGTREFATLVAGDNIEVLGPLGKGFDLENKGSKNILIVGGGVGTPPLLELAKSLKAIYNQEINITIVLGFRDEVYLAKEFEAYGSVLVATDSGKVGFKGNVIELIKKEYSAELTAIKPGFDYMYSCGPTPMLKGLQQFNKDYNIHAEFSLEERMGCGFGGCVGCVVGIRNEIARTNFMEIQEEVMKDDDFDYKKVCKDGPVFEYSEVIFQ